MGHHSFEAVDRSRNTPSKARRLGRHATRLSLHRGDIPTTGRHHNDTPPEDIEAAMWRNMRTNVVDKYRRQEKDLKNIFSDGLQRLVEGGRYDPRVLQQLSYVHLTPLVDDQEHIDPAMQGSNGFADTKGRFISVKSLERKKTVFHEFGHRLFRLGDMTEPSLLEEPAVERLAQDIVVIEGIENPYGSSYEPHADVFDKVLQIGGISYKDFTAIASGDDPELNFAILAREAWEHAGWDVVGFSQEGYLNQIHQGVDIYTAAANINNVLAQYVPMDSQAVA